MPSSEKINGTIYIVSGLPRSGISMMMQLLNGGGMKILADTIRQNDKNNPNGGMEFEKVKSISTDSTWMHEADGKALKVIAPLIHFLPDSFNYKIIFMLRDINEVLKSQQKMLEKDLSALPMRLGEILKKQVVLSQMYIRNKSNMNVLYINYCDVIATPGEQATVINSFLGMKLNMETMVKAIDKNLYGNKSINA